MANKNLTQKQKEALAPLETDAKANRRLKDRLQKRLAFEQAIGFEENRTIRERIEELDAEYTALSVEIAEIYAAESEMMKHMNRAIEEINEVNRLKSLWGFVTE